MNRLVVALTLLAPTICCSTPKKTVAETQTEEQVLQELKQLHVSLIAAIQRQNTDALDGIWAREYVGTAPTGQVVTKSELMSAIKSGVIKFDSFETDDLRVRLFGDIAILTGHAVVKASVDGEDYSGSYRGTGIFIKRGGKWEIIGVQVGLDKAAAKPGQ